MFKIWKIIIFWWILTSKHVFAKIWKIINFDTNLEEKKNFFSKIRKIINFWQIVLKNNHFLPKFEKNIILVLNGVVWYLDTKCMVSYGVDYWMVSNWKLYYILCGKLCAIFFLKNHVSIHNSYRLFDIWILFWYNYAFRDPRSQVPDYNLS